MESLDRSKQDNQREDPSAKKERRKKLTLPAAAALASLALGITSGKAQETRDIDAPHYDSTQDYRSQYRPEQEVQKMIDKVKKEHGLKDDRSLEVRQFLWTLQEQGYEAGDLHTRSVIDAFMQSQKMLWDKKDERTDDGDY